ncbi:MAG TPA: hypothetical protein PLX77_00410 [Candidatus Cloacimonadota bacterium]|nr:hypothetical protein [Candidatus Cloacimonadota bacterium]
MKKLIIALLILAALPLFAQMTLPRVYIQKLVLEDGSVPTFTQKDSKTSAEEYILRAWMEANPDEVISTETHPIHTIALKSIGKEGVFPLTAVASVQLGNFKRPWVEGDILHLVITHKASGESKGWQLTVPEGTALIKKLDEGIVIPPQPKKK